MKHRTRRSPSRRATALALALAALCALPCAAQGRESRSALERRHWAETAERYGRAAWPRDSVRAGVATDLVLDGWTLVERTCAEGLVTRAYRRADRPDARPSFVLESHVADTVELAQERLVEWLAGVQSTARLPGALELGLRIGDAGFVGRSGAAPGAIAWIAFVRGNVAVRIAATDARREPALDLGGLAALVDRATQAADVVREGAPAKPAIRSLSAPRTEVAAGAVIVLDVDVVDPAGRAPVLEWIVGGPGQGYVERGEDGRFALHATGAGGLRLVLEVTSSTGTCARRELALVVTGG